MITFLRDFAGLYVIVILTLLVILGFVLAGWIILDTLRLILERGGL